MSSNSLEASVKGAVPDNVQNTRICEFDGATQHSAESNNAIEEVELGNDTIVLLDIRDAQPPTMDELRINLTDVCGGSGDDDDNDANNEDSEVHNDNKDVVDDILTPTSDVDWMTFSLNSLIASANEGVFLAQSSEAPVRLSHASQGKEHW